MNATLTPADFATLKNFANAGDRYDYWSFLAAKGDLYAALALEVVTGSSISGFIANNYAATFATTAGLSNPNDTQAWWPVGVALMRADLTARLAASQNNENPLSLSFQAIQEYHQTVFGTLGIPAEGWTPYIPLQQYITPGTNKAWAAGNAEWQKILAGSDTITPLINLTTGLIKQNGAGASSAGIWLAKVSLIDSLYHGLLAQAGSVQKLSLRNADYIVESGTAYAYMQSSGQWVSISGMNSDFMASDSLVVTYADSATTQQLNTERQARIAEFGGDVLQISSATVPGLQDNVSALFAGSLQLSGGVLESGAANVWTSNGITYTFAGAQDASGFGTLTISGAPLGNSPSDSIVLQNFNLSAATYTAAGSDGINLPLAVNLTAGATICIDPPAIFQSRLRSFEHAAA